MDNCNLKGRLAMLLVTIKGIKKKVDDERKAMLIKDVVVFEVVPL